MKKKQKFVDVQILPHHIPEMEKSLPRGVANATEPIWLTAFAIYNMNNKLRLSIEFDVCYESVLDYLKFKLK